LSIKFVEKIFVGKIFVGKIFVGKIFVGKGFEPSLRHEKNSLIMD